MPFIFQIAPTPSKPQQHPDPSVLSSQLRGDPRPAPNSETGTRPSPTGQPRVSLQTVPGVAAPQRETCLLGRS